MLRWEFASVHMQPYDNLPPRITVTGTYCDCLFRINKNMVKQSPFLGILNILGIKWMPSMLQKI